MTLQMKSVEQLRAQSSVTEEGLSRGHQLGLTTVQVELLSLLTEGMSNVEAAERLGTTVDSVKHRLKEVCKLLGVQGASAGERRARAVLTSWLFAAGVLPRLSPGKDPMWRRYLTKREAETLLGLAVGKSNDELSEWLNITVGTAKTHVQWLIRVLVAQERVHAVRRGFELGMLDVIRPEESGGEWLVRVRRRRDEGWLAELPLPVA
jgi:DNA-binding NarL/FixJ family response regulator